MFDRDSRPAFEDNAGHSRPFTPGITVEDVCSDLTSTGIVLHIAISA